MNNNLVVITGCSSGLGLAMTQTFLARGYSVLAVVRSAMADGVEDPNLHLLQLDVTATDAPELLSAEVSRLMAGGLRLWACIFNAGVLAASPVEAFEPRAVSSIMETNFLSVLRCVQPLLPILRRQGMGSLLAVSSLSAHIGLPGDSLYAASKAALERLFESLLLELQSSGIGVGLVVPSTFQSGLFRSVEDVPSALSDVVDSGPACSLAVKIVDFIAGGMKGFRLAGDAKAESILAQLYLGDGFDRQKLAESWAK